MADFERFVAFTLLHEEIGKSIQKIKTEYMGRFGLRSGDAMTLAILDRHPDGLTAAEIARKCGVDKAVISRALPDLLSSGSVMYTDGSSVKRNYRARLRLSPQGEQIVAEMNRFSVETVRASSGDIPDADMITFYRVMRTINKNLSSHARLLENEPHRKGDSN